MITFNETIQSLYDEGVLGGDLYNKITSEQDINARDEDHINAIEHVIIQADWTDDPIEKLELLITLGADIDADNYLSQTALHLAVIEGQLKILRFLLTKMKNVVALDYLEQSALHLAVYLDKPVLVNELLRDPRFRLIADQPDLYGRSVEQLASPELPSLDQQSIYKQLKVYLEITGRDHIVDEILCELGHCNGLTFLFHVYASQGHRIKAFFSTLIIIAQWDRSLKALESQRLPLVIQEDFPPKQKLNEQGTLQTYPPIIADVFEQFINDIVLFQIASPIVDKLKLGFNQDSRTDQYDLMHHHTKGRRLVSLFRYYNLFLHEKQIVELLGIFQSFPGLSIDLTTTCYDHENEKLMHSTALEITEEGYFRYYDPEHKQIVSDFQTPVALTQHLIKFFYKFNNPYKRTYQLDFDGYYFASPHKAFEPFIRTKEAPRFSPCFFSPLYYAVMQLNTRRVKELVNLPNTRVNTKNAWGETALQRAIMLDQDHITHLIISNPNCDLSIESRNGMNALMLMVLNGNISTNTIKKAIAKSDVDHQDNFGQTALMYAAKVGRHNIVRLLLENGAKSDIKSYKGKTVYDCCENDKKIFETLFSFNPEKQKKGFKIVHAWKENAIPLRPRTPERDMIQRPKSPSIFQPPVKRKM